MGTSETNGPVCSNLSRVFLAQDCVVVRLYEGFSGVIVEGVGQNPIRRIVGNRQRIRELRFQL